MGFKLKHADLGAHVPGRIFYVLTMLQQVKWHVHWSNNYVLFQESEECQEENQMCDDRVDA